jgi:MFS family permease
LAPPDPTRLPARDARVRYAVLAWLCLAALVAYVCRNSIAVAEKPVREDLGLADLHLLGYTFTPKQQMGWVISAFFVTYAVFQLPAGWVAHVLGTRRALPLFSLLWSAATGLTFVAGGVPALVAARLGMGAAQAGIFTCTTDTVSKWFPAGRRAVASGVLGSSMSVGGALGIYLTGELLDRFGPHNWRWVFLGYSLPGVAWAAWFYLWFRDYPAEHAAVGAAELDAIGGGAGRKAGPAEPTPWGTILTSPAMWWVCGQQFFRAAGYIFFASWFATYLLEARGVAALRQAGLQSSLPLLGVVLGTLSGGALSDWVLARTQSRRLARQGLAVVSLLLCAGLILVAYAVADVWLAVLLISAGSFWSGVAGPSGYAITIDLGGRHVAMVFSMMNMAGNVGAAVFPNVVPWLVGWTGSWDLVLFVFAGVYVAAAACWLPFDPERSIVGHAGAAGG